MLTLNTLPNFGQEIINVVLVGKKGITENIKEAQSFIIVKRYPEGFRRLDYNIRAPLQKVRNYSDSNLTVLEGAYYEYANGALSLSGYYINNLKEKDWYHYNDTGKVILEEKYEKGILIKTTDPDTVKKEQKDTKLKDGEKEAFFKKGDKDWINYLTRALDADIGNKSVKGGKVRVAFTVNTSGKCVDVYLRKSVEFVLDEEAVRVIENSPTWNPAVQDGKKLNAYRIQPFTFIKPV